MALPYGSIAVMLPLSTSPLPTSGRRAIPVSRTAHGPYPLLRRNRLVTASGSVHGTAFNRSRLPMAQDEFLLSMLQARHHFHDLLPYQLGGARLGRDDLYGDTRVGVKDAEQEMVGVDHWVIAGARMFK